MGTYTVVVTNGTNSSVTSAPAVVSISVAPTITTQPASQTVTAGSSAFFSVVASGVGDTYQWSFNGVPIVGATGSTYTVTNAQAANAGTYTVTVTSSGAPTTSTGAILTVGAAVSITTQPSPQTVSVGGTFNFVVAASGTGDTYQWNFNGTPISGATRASYTVANAQTANLGSYTVTVTNGGTSITSAAATLTVNAAGTGGIPVLTVQPVSQTIVSGTTVVFNVATTASSPVYQWQFNGSGISGATNARLVISAAAAANVGTYTCVVTNAGGTTASTPATLALTTTVNVGRLINLSVNTTAGKSQVLTVGFVTGGAGTTGAQNLLIRATGPALTTFGVQNALADPTLTVFSGSNPVISDDNWGTNQAAVTAADNATGAFALTNPASLDAALVTALNSGGYTVQISGNTAPSGTTVAEVYDTTTTAAYTLATPRLINISSNNQIAANGSMTAGFVVGGTTSKTVLIRATGPALALLGVAGTMPDPQLALHTTVNSQDTVLATNAGWGGDPQITAVDTAVGAFTLTNASSKDSVVLVTLPPGAYTAVASSVTGTAGVAVIEVYEVP